jgi:Uma2 family endonuclease
MTMSTIVEPMTWQVFWQQPETQPASELIDGKIIQKPMPQGEHSLIQTTCCEIINAVAKPQKIAMAFPGLRCVFGKDVIVPDVAIFRWERIPRTASGRIANHFNLHPDWAIEILSPGQSHNLVLGKLLHCSQAGTELGWLIDPEDESILIVWPELRVQVLRDQDQLPVLMGIELVLTARQVFDCLTL